MMDWETLRVLITVISVFMVLGLFVIIILIIGALYSEHDSDWSRRFNKWMDDKF